MSSIWDDPELRVNEDYVKFETPGDSIEGVVQVIRPHRFEDGSTAPRIILITEDGTERTVTAGQVRLKALLAEQRPEAGDHLFIQFTKLEPRGGGKTLKHFDVVVTRAGQEPSISTSVGPKNVAAASAIGTGNTVSLDSLTPEQRKAIGF